MLKLLVRLILLVFESKSLVPEDVNFSFESFVWAALGGKLGCLTPS